MDSTKQNPFQRGSAANEIYDIMRREIVTLELEPGAPLDETGLSKRFNVSRSPIREVLSRLLADRLVQTLPNRTTIVAPVNLAQFPHFIEALDLQQRYATRRAARLRSTEEVSTLKVLSERYKESLAEFDTFKILQANYEFHMAIAKAGRNPYVERQYGELLSEARRLLHMHIKKVEALGHQEILEDQHDDFVDAIAAQDIEAADRIAHAHAMQFHDRFLRYLKYAPDEGFEVEQPCA